MSDLYSEILNRRGEWVKALSDDKFEQAKGTLVRQNSQDGFEYCCLGVAYEVLGSKLANPFKLRPDTNDSFCDDKFLNWTDADDELVAEGEEEDQYTSAHIVESTLNKEMAEFLGLAQWEISILISLNDGGTSFNVIGETISELPVYIDGEIAKPHLLAVEVPGE